MNVLQNIVRVLLGMTWTTVVGLPLLVVLYARYSVALLAKALGRRELADSLIERNAISAGNVAQRYWAPVLNKLARVTVTSRETAPIDWRRTHVLCANHASIFDIIALVAVVPVPYRFVAKRELLKWPILGWALHPAGQIVIDRSDRRAAIARIEEEGSGNIRGQVIFFVEGTRSRDGKLRRFKKGAFHFALDHELPILPVAICGSHGVLGRTAWWRMHVGREIRIVFREPIDPRNIAADAEKTERIPAAMECVRASIAAELDADQRNA